MFSPFKSVDKASYLQLDAFLEDGWQVFETEKTRNRNADGSFSDEVMFFVGHDVAQRSAPEEVRRARDILQDVDLPSA